MEKGRGAGVCWFRRWAFVCAVALSAWACSDAAAPPPGPVFGTVSGGVRVEGEGLSGVVVELSGGRRAQTSGEGLYRFEGVEEGAYVVTISGYPGDVEFDRVSARVAVGGSGGATADFAGVWLRTSGVSGRVSAEGRAVAGARVELRGPSSGAVVTDEEGAYAFSRIRAGAYAVEISGFDPDAYAFGETSLELVLAEGESAVLDFEGSVRRTAAVRGVALVEGAPLAGAAARLWSRWEEREDATDVDGAFGFGDLMPDAYRVRIEGFDAERIVFEEAEIEVRAEANDTVRADFEGLWVRNSSVVGRVTVEGEPLGGIDASLAGPSGEFGVVTGADGGFEFSGLLPGVYRVRIAGFDADRIAFEEAELEVEALPNGEVTADFPGVLLRNAAIRGRVSAEGARLAGVVVRLLGREEREEATDADGGYAFLALAADAYRVRIEGFDAERVFFETVELEVEALPNETVAADFEGVLLRNAAVRGRVTVEGEPLEGTNVLLRGPSGELGAATDGSGGFEFSGLLPGFYRARIAGFDAERISFDAEEVGVEALPNEAAVADFDGVLVRNSSVVGRALADGAAVAGADIALSGPSGEFGFVTGADGGFEFSGLLPGAYRARISGFDADAVSFSETSRTVSPGPNEEARADFSGTLLRTARIEGVAAVDGEPVIGASVSVAGEFMEAGAQTGEDGSFAFGGVVPGEYEVELSGYDDGVFEFARASRTVRAPANATVREDFEGARLRGAGIAGRVLVDGAPFAGASVAISGPSGSLGATTDGSGEYAFQDLLAGSYEVSVGVSDETVVFSEETVTVRAPGGATVRADFEGAALRTAAIAGVVSAEGVPIEGADVSISGPSGELDAETDADGEYGFAELIPGSYRVEIGGFDADAVSFSETSRTVSPGPNETARADFGGTLLRTARIEGVAAVDGEPVIGASVSIAGEFMEAGAQTGEDGSFAFGGVVPGEYEVELSGYDDGVFEFARASRTVRAPANATVREDFEGARLRGAGIAGRVLVDGAPFAGASVAISGPSGLLGATTDGSGEYAFQDLLAGSYEVSVGVSDETVVFSEETVTVRAPGGATVRADFEGAALRTAAIAGVVSAGGLPIEDVDVSISGPSGQLDAETDADGEYGFAELTPGSYRVEIGGFDADAVSFSQTSKTVLANQDETARADFGGALLRTARIEGAATADGEPVIGATVSISGDYMTAEAKTNSNGDYAFDGVVPGDYEAELEYDAEIFDFATSALAVSARSGRTATANFAGTRLRSARISGAVTVQGVAYAGASVGLSGPSSPLPATTNSSGEYAFEGLLAGSYEVSVDIAGVSFSSSPRTVRATAGGARADFDGSYASLEPGDELELSVPGAATILLEASASTPGAGTMSFSLSGGSGDPDLYVHHGSRPSALSGYECSSEGGGAAEQCTLTPIQSGTYYIAVSSAGAFGPTSLSVEENSVTGGSSFDIDLVFLGSIPSSVRSEVERAAATWESVITADLPDHAGGGPGGSCAATPGAVDDLEVYVTYEVGSFLGGASVCAIREGSWLPVTSAVDLSLPANAESYQSYGLALHELGHALGIGQGWSLRSSSTDPHFAGAKAVAAFNAAGGQGYTGGKVPVQTNPTHHWRPQVFGNYGELMTPWIDPNDPIIKPLSAITIGALDDLGYTVDASMAEAYSLPSGIAAGDKPAEGLIDLSNDVISRPIQVLDERGRVVRVINPPRR